MFLIKYLKIKINFFKTGALSYWPLDIRTDYEKGSEEIKYKNEEKFDIYALGICAL